MASSILLSDNGASSGSAGLKSTAGNDGVLILQTTTSSGTATNAVYIDATQNVGVGRSPSYKLDVEGAIATRSGSAIGSLYSDGTNVYCSTLTNNSLVFEVNGNAKASLSSSGNLAFNSGYGSVATAYGCRAWVNFNGTGTVAIRGSGNVSSITDNGTGNYTVNFTNAMPDTNYTATNGLIQNTGGANILSYASGYTYSTSAFRFLCVQLDALAVADSAVINVSVFR